MSPADCVTPVVAVFIVPFKSPKNVVAYTDDHKREEVPRANVLLAPGTKPPLDKYPIAVLFAVNAILLASNLILFTPETPPISKPS